MKSRLHSFTLIIVTFLGLLAAFASSLQAQESYIVVERHSKRVLIASNSIKKLNAGSFSQLATAKVAIDWAALSSTPLSTVMIVPDGIAASGLRNSLNLQTGDRISMRDALYSLSLSQDSACALTLADYVGRQMLAKQVKAGNPYEAFLFEMNNLAGLLKMKSTTFKSPAGGLCKSTVSDLAKLAIYTLKTNGYDFYMKQKSRTITVTRVSGVTQSLKLTNTNNLLGDMAISGLMVEGANSVISADKPNIVQKLPDKSAMITPRQLIVVNLGSADRDARIRQLVTTGWQMYESWRLQGFPRSEAAKEFLQ